MLFGENIYIFYHTLLYYTSWSFVNGVPAIKPLFLPFFVFFHRKKEHNTSPTTKNAPPIHRSSRPKPFIFSSVFCPASHSWLPPNRPSLRSARERLKWEYGCIRAGKNPHTADKAAYANPSNVSERTNPKHPITNSKNPPTLKASANPKRGRCPPPRKRKIPPVKSRALHPAQNHRLPFVFHILHTLHSDKMPCRNFG